MSQVVVAEKKKRGRKKQNVVLQVESTTQEVVNQKVVKLFPKPILIQWS